MKFRFPLQKIVDLREQERMQAEWRLAEALERLREEERSFAELERMRDDVCRIMADACVGATTAAHLSVVGRFLTHLDGRIRRKRAELEDAERTVSERRDDLRGRLVEERIWRNARNKALERFRSEMLRAEQKEIDDLACAHDADRR